MFGKSLTMIFVMMFLTKAKSILSLIRLEISLAIGFSIIAGEIIALGNIPPYKEMILGFLTGFFISSSAMIVNDHFDLEVDKINAPHRPLPMGLISFNEVVFLATITSIAGLFISGLLGGLTLVIAIVFWLMAFLYNWRLKETGLPGNLMVSASAFIPFIYGGVAVGIYFNPILWFFSIMAFLTNLGEEIISDVMDEMGDQKRNAKTVVRIWGRRAATYLSGLLFLVVILITFVPYVLGWLGTVYLILVTIADVVLAFSAFKLLRSRTPSEGRTRIKHLFFGMLLELFAIVFGRLYF
jgi:geranylgeranylglycerol-phosphate geranylgeranyltransferase